MAADTVFRASVQETKSETNSSPGKGLRCCASGIINCAASLRRFGLKSGTRRWSVRGAKSRSPVTCLNPAPPPPPPPPPGGGGGNAGPPHELLKPPGPKPGREAPKKNPPEGPQ